MRFSRDRRQGLVDPERMQSPKFHVQRERINGVRDAMSAAGIDSDSLTVVESYEHVPKSGGSAAEAALDANPRISALMCTADVLALSAMDYLRGRGICAPGSDDGHRVRRRARGDQPRTDHGGTVKPAQRPPRRWAASPAPALRYTGRRSAGH
jgi:hypothetical protein